LLACVSTMTRLLLLWLLGKTLSLSLFFMATCCPMSSVLRPTNQHSNRTSLLPTRLNIKAPPIRGTIVSPTSLVAGGVVVVDDHLNNTPFLVLDSTNVPFVRYVASKATRLQPTSLVRARISGRKTLQWMPTWFLSLLHQIPNGIMTPAPMFILLMSSPTSTCMLRTTLALTRSE